MEYLLHLAKDKKLKKLIDKHQPLKVEVRKDLLFYLCASIMSQQLSAKVAASITDRFLALYDGRFPQPEEILATPFETLRSIGLSNAKANYVQNVARFAIEHGLDFDTIHAMKDEDIITHLTQIKGVGRWTVEMLLMFGLGREDIFAIDDWGVQNAMLHIYNLDPADKKAFRQELLRISQKWSPYRTYACMHLWRWKDNNPVETAAKKKTQPPAKKAQAPVSKTRAAAAPKKASPAAPKKTRSAPKKTRRATSPAKKKNSPAKRPGSPNSNRRTGR